MEGFEFLEDVLFDWLPDHSKDEIEDFFFDVD